MNITNTGCYIDSCNGHYAIPAMIRWSYSMGYLPDPFLDYTLAQYDEDHYSVIYPTEALHAVANEIEAWLNGVPTRGQNPPPEIPDGYGWGWQDGDFGLWPIEDDGESTKILVPITLNDSEDPQTIHDLARILLTCADAPLVDGQNCYYTDNFKDEA